MLALPAGLLAAGVWQGVRLFQDAPDAWDRWQKRELALERDRRARQRWAEQRRRQRERNARQRWQDRQRRQQQRLDMDTVGAVKVAWAAAKVLMATGKPGRQL